MAANDLENLFTGRVRRDYYDKKNSKKLSKEERAKLSYRHQIILGMERRSYDIDKDESVHKAGKRVRNRL